MKDLKLNGNYDLDFDSGDLVIADSKGQNIEQILIAAKGEWKNNPQIGADLHLLVNDDGNITSAIKEIRFQLTTLENMQIMKLDFNGKEFDIEAEYINDGTTSGL